MFLTLSNRIVLAIGILLSLSACVTTGGDWNASNAKKSAGVWYPLGVATKGDVTYFDPNQTTYMIDGNIETFVFFSRPNGTQSTVDKLIVNCNQRMYMGYRITNSGGWQLSLDWTVAEVGTVSAQWVDNLCLTKDDDGENIKLITVQKRNDTLDQYVAWYWTPDKVFKTAGNYGKAFKYNLRDLASKKNNNGYFVLNCDRNKVAITSSLTSDDLKWLEPTPTSPAEYVLKKSCGSSVHIDPSKVSDSSSIERAKAKCADLGFKKGTEQFGNCVLKLSK